MNKQRGKHAGGHPLQPVIGQNERELLGGVLMIGVVGQRAFFANFSNL